MDIAAVAFDLDGTITKTRVKFAPYKKRIGMKKGDVLEYIQHLDVDKQQEMYKILDEYEKSILQDCVLNDGFMDVMGYLKKQNIDTGIVTRASTKHARQVIKKLHIPISVVIGREDTPPKPSGEPLILLSKIMQKPLEKMIFVGDYLWDILAGKNAQVTTILLLSEGSRQYQHLSDYTINTLHELLEIFEQR